MKKLKFHKILKYINIKFNYLFSKKIKKYKINELICNNLINIVHKRLGYTIKVDNSNSPFKMGAENYKFPDIICGWIGDVHIHGIDFVFISHKNEYFHIEDFYAPLNGDVGINNYAHSRMLTNKKIIIHRALILYEKGSDLNYFHWITESFSKIYILDQMEKGILEGVKILIPKGIKIIRESLMDIGISEEQIYEVGCNDNIEINNLLYISRLGNPGDPRPEICKYINNKLSNQIDSKKYRKIYISRHGSARKLKNERQLQIELKNKGYEIYQLEKMSFSAQVRLFSQANVIVAEHGAGLTNILFAKQNVEIYEIFKKTYINLCYWYIATILKFNYHYIVCNENNITVCDIKKFP